VTSAATRRLEEWIGYAPSTSLDEGLGHFARWYRSYLAA
jgi:UDP-glucuronate 4-epimerase